MLETGSTTGWKVGYVITIVVVLVVVALVVPILLLAHRIGGQAAAIDESLQQSVTNTAGAGAAATRRSTTPPRSSAGSTAAGPGWEADDGRPIPSCSPTRSGPCGGAPIIGGFVIVLAVAALLTILVLEVRTIDRRVLRSRRPSSRPRPTPTTPR